MPWLIGGLALASVAGFVVGRQTALGNGLPAHSAAELDVASSKANVSRHAFVPIPFSEMSDGAADRSMLAARPPSVARDEAMAQALAAFAATDPSGALRVVNAETHRWRRARWQLAVARGWAGKDPDGATHWAMTLPPGERDPAFVAVLEGVAATPDKAFELARVWCATDPALTAQRGLSAIEALTRAGAFETAVKLAGGGAPEWREPGLHAAFARWGESAPDAAAAMALSLPTPEQREIAFHAVVSGWAQTQPEKLANFALRLPGGEDSSYALGEALRQWIGYDSRSATEWLNRFEPSSALDGAMSVVAMCPLLAQRRPDVALEWAESIVDPALRSATLARVYKAWGESDPRAAETQARATRQLLPADRDDVLPFDRIRPHP